jgi:hypothetical protein
MTWPAGLKYLRIMSYFTGLKYLRIMSKGELWYWTEIA